MNKLTLSALLFSVITLHCAAEPLPLKNHPIKVPKGFKAEYFRDKTYSFNCQLITPYTGDMTFRSKYEGSDKARNTLNKEAMASYKASTQLIYTYSRYLAKLSAQIRNKGANPQIVGCYLDNLANWANNSAMLSGDKINGTGKAVRKWTLAAIASHFLRLQPALNDYALKTVNSAKIQIIEAWLKKLAYTVVQDYSNRPIKKINNHDYWAGWAVMVTSASLNDQKLFNWSYQVYQNALSHIQQDGSLPNELKRKSRAYEYHNFAIQPLVYMRAFIAVNKKPSQDAKLQKLATLIINNIDDKSYFEERAQSKQTDFEIGINGRLAWLIAMPNEMLPRDIKTKLVDRFQLQKQGNTRLGGKACELFPHQCH